jgi:hypothetical protein
MAHPPGNTLAGPKTLAEFCILLQIKSEPHFPQTSALLMTETQLRLIAAPAMIGLSSKPMNG